VLSARIGGLACGGVRVGVQVGDDAVEVCQDLLVHLDQPLMASGLGCGDDLEDLSAVLVVLGQEIGRGEEHWAGQAGVGVRAAFLDG